MTNEQAIDILRSASHRLEQHYEGSDAQQDALRSAWIHSAQNGRLAQAVEHFGGIDRAQNALRRSYIVDRNATEAERSISTMHATIADWARSVGATIERG